MSIDPGMSTTSLRRNTTTTTLGTNHCDTFVQNDLVSSRYETTPIQTGHARMPGYQGFVPGGVDVYGQRKAQATLHSDRLQPLIHSTKGQWQDMQLVDLRPEERAYNKNYVYAENTKSFFMRFPTPKTFDHRKL